MRLPPAKLGKLLYLGHQPVLLRGGCPLAHPLPFVEGLIYFKSVEDGVSIRIDEPKKVVGAVGDGWQQAR